MNRPLTAKSLELVPRPRELENYSDYIRRVSTDKAIVAYYTPARARIVAERCWSIARSRSMVCVTTSEGQFLLFGDPRK